MRTGIQTFHGPRLTQARAARAMTQTALARACGVSCASISKWERGEQFPAFATLEKVAVALEVPTAWFLQPLPAFGPERCFFRSQASTAALSRGVAQTRLEWLYELSQIIQEWVAWPTLTLPARLTRSEALSLQDAEIEALAMQCRTCWRLGQGPIDDVLRAMEGAGIVVTRSALGLLKMDGASRWFSAEGRPYVFLCADKGSAARGRFDAAHELGHILMHGALNEAEHLQHHHELERQAHLFASAFLLPAESVASALAHPTLDALLVLKSRWKVSIAALIMRARSLELIDEAYATRLWKNYSARGWRKGEPLDEAWPQETPYLMPRAIRLLLNDGGFSKARLLSTLGLAAADVETLCALPEGFFSADSAKVLPFQGPSLRPVSTRPADAPGQLLSWPGHGT